MIGMAIASTTDAVLIVPFSGCHPSLQCSLALSLSLSLSLSRPTTLHCSARSLLGLPPLTTVLSRAAPLRHFAPALSSLSRSISALYAICLCLCLRVAFLMCSRPCLGSLTSPYIVIMCVVIVDFILLDKTRGAGAGSSADRNKAIVCE